MFSKVTARASGIAVTGLFVLTMGLGIIGGGGGVVHAQDNDTGGLSEAGTCTYRGVTYSEGSKVLMDDGLIHTCHSDGTWSSFVGPSGGTRFNKIQSVGVLKAAQ